MSEDRAEVLLAAVMHDGGEQIEALLEGDPSLRADGSREALRRACIFGKEIAARVLIDAGAPTDCEDPRGHGLMHLAAMNGKVAMLELLLSHGLAVVDVCVDGGQTPMAAAAHIGSLDAARWLADRGACVDARNGDDDTPLDEALHHRHYDIGAFLLERGAASDLFHACALGHADAVATALDDDPSALDRESDHTHRTLIQTAQDHGREGIVGMLRGRRATYGLFTAAYIGDLERVVAEVEDEPTNANEKDADGSPLLHRAARSGQDDVVRALLDRGADALATDASGQNMLHIACGGGLNQGGGHVSTAEIALARGVDVNSTDANGATALHKAAWEAATDVVSLLLERGADPNIRERGGYRAIDFCWQPSQGRIYERLRDVTAGD